MARVHQSNGLLPASPMACCRWHRGGTYLIAFISCQVNMHVLASDDGNVLSSLQSRWWLWRYRSGEVRTLPSLAITFAIKLARS